jgi:hypothetical protein
MGILLFIATIILIVVISVTIWKIAYHNGFSHGKQEGQFFENCRMTKRFNKENNLGQLVQSTGTVSSHLSSFSLIKTIENN